MFGDALANFAARHRDEPLPFPVRACLGCDCTDDSACIGPDGKPCHWVGPQLCSRCVDLAEQLGLGR